MTSKVIIQSLQKVLQQRINGEGFEKVLSGLQIVAAGEGKCSAVLKVSRGHENIGGTMHGGLVCTLMDCVSTLALITLHERRPGSSTNLNIAFIRPIKMGENIRIDADILKAGRNLAFLEVTVKEQLSGKLLASGNHTKYVG